MNPLSDLVTRWTPSDPGLWTALSVALAIILLMMKFRQFLLAPPAAAGDRPAPARAPRWAPSLNVSDRRRSFRRPDNPVPVRVVGLDGNQKFDGWVRDRSVTGLCLEV